jgi:hypothetical protein
VFAWRAFPAAFSLVSLDLRMDRGAALAAADSLARAFGWAPQEGARQVAVFDADTEAQIFIELEGGGRDTLLALLADHRIAIWGWEVRRFRPGEVGETRVRFRPDGHPWSFAERVPEAAAGAALEPEAAHAVAEAGARAWGIALEQFTVVERAREVRPSGRVDHTFVYQRSASNLGEGSLRLRLVVSGDRVTEITPFVEVPESFSRRYAQMRSANEGVTLGAMIVGLVLYGGLGVGVGLFVMLRRRRVLWRAPAVVGVAFGLLMGGALANALPLAWWEYDTATPPAAFWLQQLGQVVAGAVLTALQVSLSAAAAETLSRAAFPEHPQFWQIWSRPAGASTAVLERTVVGVLLVGILLAWAVGFSMVSREWQGWWSPTDTLLQPNQLATALPWLGPVALSFHAGFWEECLFRAIPLAGAALLGERYGHRRVWIGAAFVLQAVIFAAAHAAYPAQPAYARVVELILPSFLFGFLFLRYGLLPAVVLHAGYNLVLMSVPLFVAETPGIVLSRAAVVAAGLVPLGVVLWRRMQMGRWLELPPLLWNAGWRPEQAAPAAPVPPPPPAPAAGVVPRWLMPAGLLGLAIWIATSPWVTAGPTLELPRPDAVRLAREAVAARGATLDRSWRVLAATTAPEAVARRFVWETAGDSTWRALLGDALPVPHWRIRFARFEGDVTERAEEWVVRIGPMRHLEVEHLLPEGRAGDSIPESTALELADSAIVAGGVADPAKLRLIAVEPQARPARLDWEITFADTAVTLPQGEVRVSVTVAGDEVTAVRRFVHVPETWAREWERRRAPTVTAVVGIAVGFGLIALGVVIAVVVQWARRGIDTSAGQGVALVIAPLLALEMLNSWPALSADFDTALAWGLQVGLLAIAGVLVVGGAIAVCAIVVGAALPPPAPLPRVATAGAATGFLFTGLETGLQALGNGPTPFPELGLDGYVPLLHWVGDIPLGATGRLTVLLMVLFVGERLRPRAAMQRAWYLLAGAMAMLVVGPGEMTALVAGWVVGGAAFLALARLVPTLGRRGLLIAVLVWAAAASVPGGRLDDAARWLGLGIGCLAGLLLLRLLDRSPRVA